MKPIYREGLLTMKTGQGAPPELESSRNMRSLLSLLIVAAALCLACRSELGNEPATPSEKKQIILLDIDTLRATHLGCYGYERDTSPNIDIFATRSTRFAKAFSQAPNTPPSQASILTGLYPSTHGLIYDEDSVPQEVQTLAEVLQQHGFKTGAFIDGGYMSERFGVNQGFDLYDNNRGGGLAKIGPKVFDWVREHVDEDFLLLVHTYDAHTPYASTPEPFQSMFLDGLEAPTPGFVASSEQMEEVRQSVWTDTPKTLPPNDMAWAKALYDGGIRYIDDWIGGFLKELESLGIADQALIILLSDHGEEFGEHGSVLHEKLYATVTHIPLIMKFPGQTDGHIVEHEVEALDLMPTLLDWLNLPIPGVVQGESLMPLVAGGSDPPHLAFSESPYFGVQRAVAFGDHHYIFTEQGKIEELYDLENDFNEQHNLAETKTELAGRMRQALTNWQRMIDNTQAFDGSSGPLDPETYEQLKALGYVQ